MKSFFALLQRKGIANRIYHVGHLLLAIAVDVLIILVACAGSFSMELLKPPPEHNAFFWYAALSTTLTVASFFHFKIYQRIWSQTSGHEIVVIIKAVFWAALLIAIGNVTLLSQPVSLNAIAIANILALSGFAAVRYQTRLISGMHWRWKVIWAYEFPKPMIRVLIIGAGEPGRMIAWQLKHRPGKESSGYNVLGFIDDDPRKQGMIIEGCPVLGIQEDISSLAKFYNAELIVVAVDDMDGPEFRQLLSYCEQTEARIKILPNVFDILNRTNGSPPLRDIQAEDLIGRRSVAWHKDIDTAPVARKVMMVTGAAGSIGSELCRLLLTLNPAKLILMDNNESGLHDLVMELKPKTEPGVLVPVLADVTQPDAMAWFFSLLKPQIVFHSAAYKHVPILEEYPDEAVRINIGGTWNMVQMACQYHVERLVFISTDKAVAPSSVMGASKRICELLISTLANQSRHETLFTSVRFGNVLGSRGSVVPIFNRQIEGGGPVTVTHPDMTRYFMSITEAASLVIQAACMTQGGELFMLRMGDAVRITDLAERMIRLRGLRPYVDIPIEFTGVRPGEKLCEALNEDYELTLPTPHPDILKLVPEREDVNGQKLTFWVEALLQNGLHYSASGVEQLLAVIEASKKNGSALTLSYRKSDELESAQSPA